MSHQQPFSDDLKNRPDTPLKKRVSGSVHSNLPLDPKTKGAESAQETLAMETRTSFVVVEFDTFMNVSFPKHSTAKEPTSTAQDLLAFDVIKTTAKVNEIKTWLKRRSPVSESESQSADDAEGKDSASEKEEPPLPIGTCRKEAGMYDGIATAFQKFLGNSLKICITGEHADPSAPESQRWRPDLSVYELTKDVLSEADLKKHPTQFAHIQLPIEVKKADGPPVFSDKPPGLAKDGASEMVRGQLATILAAISARQFRTAVFMIYLRDPDVRLIRADRAGVLVSEAINFRVDPHPLATFLGAFGRATREERGFDGSAKMLTVPSDPEAVKTKQNPGNADYPDWSPKPWNPLWEVTVPSSIQDDDVRGGHGRQVLVWNALGPAKSLTGRATSCYEAWDVAARKRCFLKNYWRPDVSNMESESTIIQTLREKGVKRIPVLLAGDDVSPSDGNPNKKGSKDPAIKLLNRTIAQDYFPKDIRPDPRVNHRLLMDIVPRFLVHCTGSRQLFQAIHDAFEAHRQAYQAGYLHRDISSGNVLVDQSFRGVLCDWDLAVPIVKGDTEGPKDAVPQSLQRQVYRTGTWSFMSINLLSGGTGPHTLADDLQSFLWLTTHVGAEVLPLQSEEGLSEVDKHASVSQRRDFIENVLESFQIRRRGLSPEQIGGSNKVQFCLNPNDDYNGFVKLSGNEALTKWIETLSAKWGMAVFQKDKAPADFMSHSYMETLFQEALTAPDSQWSSQALPQKSLVWPNGYDVLKATKAAKKEQKSVSDAPPTRSSQRNKDTGKSSLGGR